MLIQGPPGTGKTTVIAEICYQVALRGGRTLIASQSNLAVDNALGRIIHHPRVRALRKGNPETVEDEGRAYTEEHVVRKWLNNTAKECQAKLEQRQKNIALFRRLRGATERFVYYRAMEVAWENQHLSLQRRHAALTQEIREIADSIAQNEEEERKYAPIRQALSVLLAGEINQSRSETSTALQGAFQYLFVETADRLHFITQVNTGLRIVQQVDLAPPADRHLLACLVWLKETMHTHNTAWTRSRQLIDQTEDEMASLSRAGRLQQELASSIRDKKSQVQALAAQMESLQTTLQHLDGEMDRLQRATATLQMLPKDGVGSIASILKKFLDTELPKQLAGQRQFTRLEIRTAFPHEIIAVIQGDAAAAFLKWWDGAERTIQARLQRVLREIEEYNQNRDRFRRCGQDFQKALALYPEIQQQLVAVPLGSPSLPNISFSQLVSLIENNVKWIHEIHTKSPGFMDKVLKEKEKQLLMLFIATRDLGVAAQRQQNSIPDEINQANARFTENIATNLSSSLLQWLNERQQEVENTRQTALQKKDHLEAEREHILKLCEEEEARLAEAKRSFNASIQRLTGMFQELSKCTRIPETLRRAARQNASSIATALTASEEYRTACQNWIGDLQHLEALVDELWRELQAAHGKLQQQVAQIQAALGPQRHRASKLRSEREELETLIQHKHSTLQAQRQWWGEFWETIPQHLRPLAPPEGIFALPLLETVEKQFMAWETELAKEEYKAQRYDRLITDWITALRNLSEGEQAKLQEVYIQNANVIGITCGQAPRLTRRELRTFASFDTVIIDEVSKATAPELLLPAIKGKKLILIGDQHQLPPMIDADKTFEQALEESGQDPQAYRYLKESYFKDRYNEAPDAIKRMLSIQYRMHPDIMAAINQFYEHPLECGLNQPDSERDHQLESALVRKNKHLIWVTTPLVSVHMPKQHSRTIAIRNRSTGREVFRYQSAYHSFGDQADATSYINLREGELIEKICEEFQRIWALKKAAGAPPKEIGVITFYASQANLLYDRLLRGGNGGRFDALNIRIGTVDRFQGMERAVIIVSMVRNNSQRDIGFARRDERINVAFSRAQQLLIIVGCHDLFCGTARYEEAVERYDNISKIVKKRGDFIDVSCI